MTTYLVTRKYGISAIKFSSKQDLLTHLQRRFSSDMSIDSYKMSLNALLKLNSHNSIWSLQYVNKTKLTFDESLAIGKSDTSFEGG